MCSLRISERHDDDFDMLSTPSSFHCCLSQDSITYICLSPLLSSVLLEWCSSVLPPNLVKRELASTPTLSLDFLTGQAASGGGRIPAVLRQMRRRQGPTRHLRPRIRAGLPYPLHPGPSPTSVRIRGRTSGRAEDFPRVGYAAARPIRRLLPLPP